MAVETAVRMVDGVHQAATLLHPMRLRIMETLDRPDSATGLARKLGLPRQKINYHLRELEREGLVTLVEERKKRNCVERVVRAVAQSFLIDPAALGNLAADPSRIRDRFSLAYLVAVAARAIRDLAVIQRRADKAGKPVATLTLQADVRFASAADRNAFAEELAQTVATLAARYHDEKAPDGRLFRCIVGAYPAITKDEAGNSLPEQEDRR
jgi:DNA-binding transcriptional ArsR family regulator